ncbi:MAG: hypothetical protein AAFZ11_04060 [Pseudomonadota bacterium]
MYSEDDINSAIAAGAISAEAAAGLRDHVSRVRALPRQSEENFKLLNSFNDVFVAVGIVILLIAVGAIGQALANFIVPESWGGTLPSGLSAEQLEQRTSDMALNAGLQVLLPGLFVAAAAWPLSEFFTRKRRMALPSILLLLAFVGGVFACVFGLGMTVGMGLNERVVGAAMVILAGAFAAGAAYFHWRRFQVPITVAAGAGVTVISTLLAIAAFFRVEFDSTGFYLVMLITGLIVFAFAMRWDMTDRERITRRSDVAFWLHLLAAPLIAHSIFAMIGVTEGRIDMGAAFSVLGMYVAFGLVALAIDRRALLVSALAYVLFALTFLFNEFGAVELGFALTALIIGSALLSLSAFWQPIRASVVAALPVGLRARLPEPEAVAPVAPSAPPATPAG